MIQDHSNQVVHPIRNDG